MQLATKQRRLIRTGLIFCLYVILLEVIFIAFSYTSHTMHDKSLKKMTAFVMAIVLSWIVSLVTSIFITPVIAKKAPNRFLSLYLPSYFLAVFFTVLIWNLFLRDWIKPNNNLGFLPFILILHTLILLTLELSVSRYDEANVRIENARLKMLSLEAQHEKLKSQLHPHFLFNSLNALKVLIKKQPDIAESYLVKLSSFLRFSISHNEHNIVALKEELKISLDYLEMQKIRFGNALTYSISIPDAVLEQARIPVFSLQVLLENAIKHNGMTEQEPLMINIVYAAPDNIIIGNNLSPKTNTEPGLGLGLRNLAERYRLLLNHDLVVDHSDHYFRVHLKLTGEYSHN